MAYFCYHCHRPVDVTTSDSGDRLCSICRGEFVGDPNSNPFPAPILQYRGSPLRPATFHIRSEIDAAKLLGISPPRPGQSFTSSLASSSSAGPQPFNPAAFLHQYVTGHGLVNAANDRELGFDAGAGGGGRGGGGASGFPANLAKYTFRSGLENVIRRMAENNGKGPRTVLDLLADVKITDTPTSDLPMCAVCQEGFKIGQCVKEMPCKHQYHEHCIEQWLEGHKSCPLCRKELPTDDLRNVQEVGVPEGTRTVRTGLIVPLQWPFCGTAALALARNTSNDGGTNAGDGGTAALAVARNMSNDGGTNAGDGGEAALAEARNTSNDRGTDAAGDGGAGGNGVSLEELD